MKNVSSDLKAWMMSNGLTQKKISDALGTSTAYVNTMMCGKKPFGRAAAKKWQEAFGLNASWLMTGEGSMLISPAVSPEPSVPATPKLQPDALSLDVLVRKIAEQAEEIGRLKAENAALKTLHKE